MLELAEQKKEAGAEAGFDWEVVLVR